MKSKILKISKILKRTFYKAQWRNLRSTKPISRVFGFDRGTPIDRVYIEDFLTRNRHLIRGTICEIGDDTYAKKFATEYEKIEVLHYTEGNPKATIVGDLTRPETLPKSSIDCFILTQTLNFIYDFKSAIKGVHYMLKPKGVVLATVAGISQISRYDYERWGDYWRFTDMSIKRAFEEVFGTGNVEVFSYGNVLTAVALLEGISAEELTRDEIFYRDEDYPVVLAVKAVKR